MSWEKSLGWPLPTSGEGALFATQGHSQPSGASCAPPLPLQHTRFHFITSFLYAFVECLCMSISPCCHRALMQQLLEASARCQTPCSTGASPAVVIVAASPLYLFSCFLLDGQLSPTVGSGCAPKRFRCWELNPSQWCLHVGPSTHD